MKRYSRELGSPIDLLWKTESLENIDIYLVDSRHSPIYNSGPDRSQYTSKFRGQESKERD